MKKEKKSEKVETSKTLTPAERKHLAELEEIISKGADWWLKAGLALIEIRDAKLYREDFKTFAEYTKAKWSWTASRAYQIIDAAQAQSKVQKQITFPSARAAEEFAKVPEKKKKAVAKKLEKKAKSGKKITSAEVKESVGKKKPRGGLFAAMSETKERNNEPRVEEITTRTRVGAIMQTPAEKLRNWYAMNRKAFNEHPQISLDELMEKAASFLEAEFPALLGA